MSTGDDQGRPLRSVRLHGPGDVRLEHETLRAGPAAGEVLLELEAALTGGTVLKTVRRGGHARLGTPPLTLGHEGVGRVWALGEGVKGLRVGDRVLPGPSAPCGACERCRGGREQLCSEALWWSGLFTDLVRVPARVVRSNLHRVPPGLPAERVALADNVACVRHGQEVTPGRRDERALVIGTGPMGLLWVDALRRAGAHVTLAGRRPEAVAAGMPFGAHDRVLLDTLGEAPRFDLVIEAVGQPETWQRALALVAPGGRVNFFGGAPAGTALAVDAGRLHYEELTLTAAFHYAPRHLTEALAWLASGPRGPEGDDLADLLLGERVAIAALPDWLKAHLAGHAPRKAVVSP